MRCERVVGACVVFLAMAGSACRGKAHQSPSSAHQHHVLRATEGPFERRVLLSGEVDAVAAAELKVPSVENGRAPLRWLVKNGATVAKGDRLAEFDNSAFANELQQKTIQVSQAETELQRQMSQAALAQSEKLLDVERKRIAMEKARLNADMPPQLFSKRDVLEAKLALTKAETEWQRAKEALAIQRQTSALDRQIQKVSLDKVRGELKVVQEGLTRLALTAPLAGIALVADHWEGRPLQVGDEVFMGMTVVRMPDLNQIRVKAFLADVDDGQIAVGMSAEVIVDTYSDKVFPARVVSISTIAREPMQKSLRRVFEVSLQLEGALDRDRLRPGLSARVEVIASKLEKALIVPRTTIEQKNNQTTVQTTQGPQKVTLGPCNSSSCVVQQGLAVDTPLREGAS